MEAGHTSASRRGATIYTLADDPSSRWFVLARRVLDDLETAPHVLASVISAPA